MDFIIAPSFVQLVVLRLMAGSPVLEAALHYDGQGGKPQRNSKQPAKKE
jgi:hypothetical protein